MDEPKKDIAETGDYVRLDQNAMGRGTLNDLNIHCQVISIKMLNFNFKNIIL